MLALNRSLQNAILNTNLPATPSTTQWGTRLTAHATPHSKGAYATLLTPTYDVFGFWLGIGGTSTSATQTDQMVDIAIGSSQQNVILPEYLCGWRPGQTTGVYGAYFPLYVPAGVVISGRIQALITVDILDILILANEGSSGNPGQIYAGCDAYGTVVASSQGTSHTPGDTGAESTAANIGGTTSRAYSAVMLMVQGTMANVTMTNSLAYHWGLVIGGVTIAEWWLSTNSSEYVNGPFPNYPFPVSIPAGTQLQVQAECSGIAQAMDVALYCFY